MSTRIYIGNLAFSTTDEALNDLASDCGAVKSATVARDRLGTRSRGFGFVEFEEAASAANAVETLNGQEFEGRTLRVELEKPKSKEERAAERERRRAATKKRRADIIAAAESGESKVELTNRVYVGNLPYDTTEDELAGLFSSLEGFVGVEIASDSNGPKGFGYVEFGSQDQILSAISDFDGYDFKGRNLDVQREMPKTDRRRSRRRRGRGARKAGDGDAPAEAAAAPAPAPIENNPCKVYVGNVPFTLTDEELRACFDEFGAISEAAIPQTSSGRRLGFAYVTFETAEAASAAAAGRNETDLGGRTIRVELENRKPKRRRGRGGNRRRRTAEE